MDLRTIPDKDLALMMGVSHSPGYQLFKQYVTEAKLKPKQTDLNIIMLDSQDKVLRFSFTQGYVSGATDILNFLDRLAAEFQARNDK